jgi:hypothetical protein
MIESGPDSRLYAKENTEMDPAAIFAARATSTTITIFIPARANVRGKERIATSRSLALATGNTNFGKDLMDLAKGICTAP